MKTANHYSHSFELNLTNIPGKASDRIALRILYPGLLAGFALMLLALYEVLTPFSPAFPAKTPNRFSARLFLTV